MTEKDKVLVYLKALKAQDMGNNWEACNTAIALVEFYPSIVYQPELF